MFLFLIYFVLINNTNGFHRKILFFNERTASTSNKCSTAIGNYILRTFYLSTYLHIMSCIQIAIYMFRLILCIFTAAVAPVQSNKAFARQTDGRLFESQPQQTSNVDKTRNSALMYKQFLYVFLLQTKLWIKKFIFISMMQNTKQVCEGNLETGK